MDKLVLISGSGCAGCTSLHMEVGKVLPSFPDLRFEEYSIDQGEDRKIAVAYGYQPAEVLSYWLQDIIRNKTV